MSSSKSHSIWLKRLALILIAALVMFYHLIPFTLIPTTRPSPDILFCIICALIIRRPEIVPFGIIGLIYFSFDIFQMKPLGVWTACVLVTTEILRSNRDLIRENLFPFEWLSITLIFFLTLTSNRIFMAVSFVPTPPISDLLWEFIFTAITYPLILFIVTYVFRIRKAALGEIDIKGYTL